MNPSRRPLRVLVAGGHGFIGCAILRELQKRPEDFSAVALVRRALNANSKSIEWDLVKGTPGALAEQLRMLEVDAIINCTGTTRPDATALQADNVEAVRRLVEAGYQARPGVIYCQVGSAAEYEAVIRPGRTAETTPTKPSSDYGKSKLAGSNLVLEGAAQNMISGYVLRLSNPIGPHMPSTQLVGRIQRYLATRTNGPLELGDLGAYRDYIDIRDVTQAVIKSITRAEEVVGHVINIGSGKATQTRELVQLLFLHAARGEFRELGQDGSLRSQGNLWQEADIEKGRTLIDWQPRYSLEESAVNALTGINREMSLNGIFRK